MDSGDAFEVMEKFGLMEKAERECIKKKIATVPLDMVGRNKVYCEVLDNEWIAKRNICDTIKKQKCTNAEAISASNTPHNTCFFNRLSFVNIGYCVDCKIGIEIAKIEDDMKQLSEASNALKIAADNDYNRR